MSSFKKRNNKNVTTMVFYLIGTGLYDENDLSLRAIGVLKACSKVYIENYTNTSKISLDHLKKLIEKEAILLDREKIESGKFLRDDVALLVPGDPMNATTHVSLLMQCKEEGISYKVIHGSSIISAAAESGLSSYRFGGVVSIPWPKENYNPKSFNDAIKKNQKANLHTLILLDTQPPMSIPDALKIMQLAPETKLVALSSLGADHRKILYEPAKNLINMDFDFPQALIMPAKLNHIEEEAVGNL